MGKYEELTNGKPSAYSQKRGGKEQPGNYQSFSLT